MIASRLTTLTFVALILAILAAPANAASTPTTPGSSQKAPLPLVTPATIGDNTGGTYHLAVTGTVKNPDAWLSEDNFGDTPLPPSGQVYVIVHFKLEAVNPKMGSPYSGITYTLVGSRGTEYTELTNFCKVAVPSGNDSMPVIYPGSKIIFNQCWTVPVADASTVVLKVGSYFSGKTVWFAIR